MKFPKILAAGALLTGIIAAAPYDRAQAVVIVPPPGSLMNHFTYNVTLNQGVSGVSDIDPFELLPTMNFQGRTVCSYGNPMPDTCFGAFSRPFSLGPGTSSITATWNAPPFRPVIGAFAIGLTGNLPGDPIGTTTTHLVVLGNLQPGIAFSTLFPDVNENNLIADLLNGSIFSLDPNVWMPVFANDVDPLLGDAFLGGMFINPNNGPLNVVAFSGGQLIGTGNFSVPEPGTLALFGAGLAGFGMMRLRRRKAKG
jgi:hypothetical protein